MSFKISIWATTVPAICIVLGFVLMLMGNVNNDPSMGSRAVSQEKNT